MAHRRAKLTVLGRRVDSIEHGCSLDLATLDTMAATGMAWTPTLTAFSEPLPDDLPPERRALFAGSSRISGHSWRRRPPGASRSSLEAGGTADVVTFHEDPRDDPDVLSRPAAVVVGGFRIV